MATFTATKGRREFIASADQHGIAITEESIALANGFGIGLEDELAPAGLARSGKGADEHQQRRTRKMKIGQKRAGNGKLTGRMNEDSGASRACHDSPAVLSRHGLKHAERCRADGDNATMIPASRLD